MRLSRIAIACLGGLLSASDASAQLVLPGAQPPSAQPSVAPPAGGVRKSTSGFKRKSGGDDGKVSIAGIPSIKPPGEESLAGRQLQRNGATGVMAIEKSSGGLEIAHLAFVGYQISKPSEVCRVEVGGGASVPLKPAPRNEGLFSYSADLAACPFSMDVLDGAARVRGTSCDFVAADCRVDPAGVWGPSGAAIGPEEGKNVEKMRAKAESDARASFRTLLSINRKDRPRVKELAREQASFSSIREEICRDYAREDKHGFCASRITMAHAVSLSAELKGPSSEAAVASIAKPRKKRPKPKPVAASPDAPSPIQ